MGPRHGDEVGLAVAEDAFRLGGLDDPARGDDGYVAHGALDALGKMDEGHGTPGHVGELLGHAHVVVLDAVGDAQIVEVARVLQPARDLGRLVELQAVGDELVGAEPEAEGHAGADGFADGRGELQREARPVLEAAAVLVGPEVGRRRNELGDEEAVRAVNLNAVHAGALHVDGAADPPFDELADLGLAHLMGDFGEPGKPDAGGGPDRLLGVHAGGAQAGVDELGEDLRAVLVYGAGDLAIVRDRFLVPRLDGGAASPCGGVHPGVFQDDEADAAASPRGLIGGEGGRGAVVGAQPGGVGRADHTVTHLDRADA